MRVFVFRFSHSHLSCLPWIPKIPPPLPLHRQQQPPYSVPPTAIMLGYQYTPIQQHQFPLPHPHPHPSNNTYQMQQQFPHPHHLHHPPAMMQQQQNPRLLFHPIDQQLPDVSPSGSDADPIGGEPPRKKRGRPRKYPPDDTIALGLSPAPVAGHEDPAVVGGTPSSGTPTKRRGRPPGSGKKQLDALGISGVGFTPHVIMVPSGEDIASKIMAFSKQGPRTVCILSANGSVHNVTLRQPGLSGGVVTYEGRFEIISLSGSFPTSDSNGIQTGTLSVSLAGSDGRVLGGGVAGMLNAASLVQIVVGSFAAEEKKPKDGPSSNPGNPQLSPPSDIGSSSDSDDGNPLAPDSGPYGNTGHPVQNVPIYSNMGWSNSSIKM